VASTTNYYTLEGEIVGEKSTGQGRLDYIPDALGTVRKTLDQSRTAQYTGAAISPYGQVVTSVSNTPAFTWVGTLGYQNSVGAGMPHADYYVRARFYGAPEGRWTTVDPLWPSSNAYEYGSSSPASLVDPLGLKAYALGQFRPNNLRTQLDRPAFNSAYARNLAKYKNEVVAAFNTRLERDHLNTPFYWLLDSGSDAVPLASQLLRHYFEKSGVTVTIDGGKLLHDSDFQLRLRNEFNEFTDFVGNLEPERRVFGDVYISSTKASNGAFKGFTDLHAAIGDYQVWGKGLLTRYPCKNNPLLNSNKIGVRFTLCMYKRYNFDKGKFFYGLSLDTLSKMPEYGLAREFDIYSAVTSAFDLTIYAYSNVTYRLPDSVVNYGIGPNPITSSYPSNGWECLY